MAHRPPPPLPPFQAAQRDQLLEQLRAHLPAELYCRVEALLAVLFWVLQVLAAKKTSLERLLDISFRPQNEKASRLLGPASGRTEKTPPGAAKPKSKPKGKGHGRRKAGDYSGAQRLQVPHPHLCPGQLCPKCGRGTLYELKPAQLIWVRARSLFEALLHELQRLRCSLCGAVFSAPLPAEAAQGKYDPSVGVMLAVLRYGAGLPMYRIEQWQDWFGVPLPAATQWELIEKSSHGPALVYDALMEAGAQGDLIHHDDTSMRVQSLRQQIVAQPEGERTGIFTTSLLCQHGPHPIALFLTGRQHAGENLDQLLKRRAAGLDKPLQMCDALSRNQPKESATLECNCLLHGRRNFVEQLGNFPEECRKVIQSIGQIYQTERQIQEAGLSPSQRLAAHQAQSGPVMEELRQWMQGQLDDNLVEPNSGLGKALKYMINHWAGLTRFLQVSGAPLDNNICERTLKMCIRHRKNSLSYKTERGAKVGDIFMSLIQTCQLNEVNPFDYLNTLQIHASLVAQEPSRWLPWNYQQALAGLDSG